MLKKKIFIMSLLVASIFQIYCLQNEKIEKANEIIDQSITKLGGWENFDKINNLSFKTSSKDYRTVEKTYFADNKMNFKMTAGYGPYIERVTIYRNGKISDNNFLRDEPLSKYDEAELTCFAKLVSGVFTLLRFKGDLTYTGKKKYGFKEYFILETTLCDHDVSFYLESDTFLLGRMIISGSDEAGVLYQSMFDFKEPIKREGITMPGDWAHNILGSKEKPKELGNKIETFDTNQKTGENFWEDSNLNFGSVKFENGGITGNVIESWVHHRLQIMMMATNIRWKDMEKLNLKQHDDLIVSIEGVEYSGLYFPDRTINPPRHKYGPAVIFAGDIVAPYIGFFMWDNMFREKYENKTLHLSEVKIQKK